MNVDSTILRKLKDEFGETFYLLDSAQFKKNYIELKKQFSNIYLILISHIPIKQIMYLNCVKL